MYFKCLARLKFSPPSEYVKCANSGASSHWEQRTGKQRHMKTQILALAPCCQHCNTCFYFTSREGSNLNKAESWFCGFWTISVWLLNDLKWVRGNSLASPVKKSFSCIFWKKKKKKARGLTFIPRLKWSLSSLLENIGIGKGRAVGGSYLDWQVIRNRPETSQASFYDFVF